MMLQVFSEISEMHDRTGLHIMIIYHFLYNYIGPQMINLNKRCRTFHRVILIF